MTSAADHGTASARVAAVTLNWHDTVRTLECVRGLVGADQVARVIVADNESSGELAREAGDAGLDMRIMPLAENRGFAGGMNPALRAALDTGAEYVLAINNDATIDARSIDRLVAIADSDQCIGAVAPTILNSDRSIQTTGIRWRAGGAVLQERPPSGPLDSLTWACVLVRAAALRDVGLLDERFFMYWEDFEFSRRLTSRGWRLVVAPEATAIHALSSSARRAGSRLATYNVWGLLTLGAIRRGADRRRALVRLAAVIGKRVARGDVTGLLAIALGVRYSRYRGRGFEILEAHPMRRS